MLSRNSNSSRAIPPERQIEKVRNNPFVPETFNKRVKGMGVGEALDEGDAKQARQAWLWAADRACEAATDLLELDCDKSRINRLLEPFLWHSAVISATEWDNFFALRDHPAAQPEFQIIAKMMRKAMDESEPVLLDYGQWHLPGVAVEGLAVHAALGADGGEAGLIDWEKWKRVSAGRLARWTSYNLTTEDPVDAAIERAEKLIGSFHMSPTEHQARPLELGEGSRGVNPPNPSDVFVGNYRGWLQYRKEIPNEHNAALAVDLA